MELENTVRDGSPAHLDDFLEKMESLKEAMSFFKTHQTYASKKENMQQTFESGCLTLESEFGSLIKSETQVLDPIKIIECLDEDYEIMSFRLTGMKTIKNVEKLNKIAKWMLKNGNISTIREKYANYRSENINKTLKMIVDQQSGSLTPAQRQTRAAFLKLAIKKATGRSGDKSGETADVQKDASINSALLLLSAFLILSQLETDVCTAVFEDVTEVANVFRETIAKPLRNVLEKCTMILEQYEGSFAGMLQMAKFAIRNSNQLHTLSTNVDSEQLYVTFNQNVFRKSSQLISDFIDKLSNDHSRFVPEDGNVHQITSNTIKFLNILAKNRPTVNQILEITVTGGKSTAAHFFAQILAALGVNLKNKASTYPDESLSALFMLNNLNYVHGCLQDENVQTILGERSEQLASFYRTEITEYLTKYLKSWQRISNIFSSFDSDKRAIKAIYSAFNKEFDAIIEAQKFYTISDPRMVVEIRRKVKDLVLRPYQDFCN
uniref:Exocyst complex component 7 n=1 Tax=Panagrolaimus sp. ES5 TaxID=591445 RepID=A0AC34G2F1_9BILA